MTTERRIFIVKWCLYAVIAALIIVLQDYLFIKLKIFGVHPIFTAALVASVAMFEGGVAGGIFGALAGFIQGIPISGGEGYFAAVYLVGGLLCGVICRYMFDRRLLTALLWSLILNIFSTCLFFLLFFLLPRRAGVMALLTVGLPEIIYSTLVAPIVYFAVKWVAFRTATEEETL